MQNVTRHTLGYNDIVLLAIARPAYTKAITPAIENVVRRITIAESDHEELLGNLPEVKNESEKYTEKYPSRWLCYKTTNINFNLEELTLEEFKATFDATLHSDQGSVFFIPSLKGFTFPNMGIDKTAKVINEIIEESSIRLTVEIVSE